MLRCPANHRSGRRFRWQGEVIALAVAPATPEAVKGDNVARRVGGNGAQHHRHALALQIVTAACSTGSLMYWTSRLLFSPTAPERSSGSRRAPWLSSCAEIRRPTWLDVLTGEVLRGKARAIVEFFNGPQHTSQLSSRTPGLPVSTRDTVALETSLILKHHQSLAWLFLSEHFRLSLTYLLKKVSTAALARRRESRGSQAAPCRHAGVAETGRFDLRAAGVGEDPRHDGGRQIAIDLADVGQTAAQHNHLRVENIDHRRQAAGKGIDKVSPVGQRARIAVLRRGTMASARACSP